MMRDENDVQKLEEQIKQFNPFNREGEELVCISTNDVAGNDIREDLLTATQRGREQLAGLLEKRLLRDATQSIHDPIVKNKSKTFESLNLVEVSTTTGRGRTIKADRDLFRRLLSAANSGRQLDLKALLQHKSSPVPLAITTTDYTLLSTEKAALFHLLADSYAQAKLPETDQATCVIVDGMAAVQALGKPSNASTFGDLAECFCDQVFSNLRGSQTRLDIVFDEYRQKSIKADTRASRSAKRRKIRRIIDGRGVRLPAVWQTFIPLQEKKLNLIDFLREQILVKAKTFHANYKVVVPGGDRFPAVSLT